jgi:hypothetical protein
MVFVFLSPPFFLVEGAGEIRVKTKHDDVHVEGGEVDDSLVDVLTVGAVAAILQKYLHEAIHRPQDFCCEGIVGCDPVLVRDAVLPCHIRHKFQQLLCQNALVAEEEACG